LKEKRRKCWEEDQLVARLNQREGDERIVILNGARLRNVVDLLVAAAVFVAVVGVVGEVVGIVAGLEEEEVVIVEWKEYSAHRENSKLD
jgi:hypothetical protein